MSKHRVKNIAADDDLYNDYDEDEYEEGVDTLTAEDKKQLRLGTLQVRNGLGPAFQATDNEIQEALWHYYYDVAKSLSYLKNKQGPPAQKPPQQTSPASRNPTPNLCPRPLSTREFFQDCPWYNIPPHRKADILVQPLYPGLGLLGGASPGEGKMSKLAMLAAKRRQKENEKPLTFATQKLESKNGLIASLSAVQISSDPTDLGETSHNTRPSRSLPVSRSLRLTTNAVTDKPSTGRPTEPASAARGGQTPIERGFGLPRSATEMQARPSAFANIMLGSSLSSPRHPIANPFSNLNKGQHLQQGHTESFQFTDPSPDDIITKAQNFKGSNASTTSAKPKGPEKGKERLTNGVKNISLDDQITTRNKNLDILAEYKKTKRKNAANFVVIGHVDAGKSTLMGRLLFDLKAVDLRTMEKYKQEAERIGKGSFAFAWILDQGSEERTRGVTIDIATNKFETERTSFTILDAPGHRDFVPNMIAGASQADFAVLVIDATTGNFESGLRGQTKEHALLVRSMGVQQIIVAVNKMDAADWSQDRFREIEQQMSAFLTTAGFQPKNISFIPCSGLQGDNILRHSEEQKLAWYKGHSLVEALDTSEPTLYAIDRPLRMTIGDVFRGGVKNPLSVSGRIESGSIQAGEQALVMPSGEKALIRSLEVDDEPTEWAVAGQNVVLHLADIEQAHVKTGDMLCNSRFPVENITTFSAKVLAFEHLTPMHVDLHRGRLHVPGRISRLVATLDKASGEISKKRPKVVQPGSVTRIVVDLEGSGVPLEAGRIVLRANGETIAAGLIE